MHEIGIAKGILKKSLEVAEVNKGKTVIKINVRAGNTEMLTQDSLQEAFTLLARDTVARNAMIELQDLLR